MRTHRHALALLPLLLLGAALLAPPAAAQAAAAVRISGDVPRPVTLRVPELAALPRTRVEVGEHGNPPVVYEGVLLSTVLERAGVQFGKELRGARLATAVVVDAADGYHVTFGIAELDSAFTARRVLLVDRAAGEPLNAAEGPLRLVISGESRPARWVRQVVGIRVIVPPPPG